MTPENPVQMNEIHKALELFDLTLPFTRESLNKNYEKARRTWHPARYAGLTNNPGKYMEMYKKGEAKTKEVQEAYKLLLEYLHEHKEPSPPGS